MEIKSHQEKPIRGKLLTVAESAKYIHVGINNALCLR
jgi:hypothetical protein